MCRGRGKMNVVSLRKDTWFGQSKLTLKRSLFMTYCFVYNMSYEDTTRETSIELVGDAQNPQQQQQQQLKTSSETVSDYKHYFRDICLSVVIDESYDKIGCPGTHVEIDETKFGKRKYSCGHVIEGQWVLGGICRETKEIYLVTVPSHDKETVIPIIKDKI